ncbi:MAG: DUF1700 domain-containing protein [Oscillospiraceae bacterium]
MTKQEYLSELESHLASLSEDERVNALQFYEEYFEDAGPENEQQVISELGKPFALAKSIICEQSAYSKSKSFANYKASISANYNNSAEADIEPDVAPDAAPQQPHTQYTAYNYTEQNDSTSSDTSSDIGEKFGSYEEYKENYGNTTYSGTYNAEDHTSASNGTGYDNSYKRKSTYHSSPSGSSDPVALVLFILLVVFILLPIIIAIAFIALGFLIGGAGCLIGTLVFLIISIIKTSAFHLGVGILCAGLTMTLVPLGLLMAAKLLPKMIKWIIETIKKLSGGVVC